MTRIELNEAKRQLGALIDVALSGEEVLITQDQQPVLKLVRVTQPAGRRKAGSAKGLIKLASDFDAPLEEFRPYME
jgi:antitoxin (DNA-binding transcriptional repressor) of toxin-antitoxin stability system